MWNSPQGYWRLNALILGMALRFAALGQNVERDTTLARCETRPKAIGTEHPARVWHTVPTTVVLRQAASHWNLSSKVLRTEAPLLGRNISQVYFWRSSPRAANPQNP